MDGLIHSNPEPLNSSPIRKTPQFLTEINNNFNTNNLNENNSELTFPKILTQNQENIPGNKNMSEDNKNGIHLVTESVTPPSRYISPAVGSSVKPFQRISGLNSKQKPNENRIHFPNDKEVDSVVSQPFISDPISPFAQTNSRPSKPNNAGSHHSQYNNANKFRLKPSPIMTQSSQSMSPFGNPQKPNQRLPPFLLHTHSGTNSPQSNRHKPMISSTPHSVETLSKTILNENKNLSANTENSHIFNVTDLSINVKYDSNESLNLLTPEYHSTLSSVISLNVKNN